MKRIVILFAVVATAALVAWQGPYKLPAPYATPSATNRPRVIERPDGARLNLPQGFEIAEYAADFNVPRFMLLGPSGELLLSDAANQGAGKVYILFDKNKDGKAEDRKVLIEGLSRPYGMAFWKDYLYVAETLSVKRYKYDKAAMKAGPGEEVVSFKDFGQGHWTRSIVFDREGRAVHTALLPAIDQTRSVGLVTLPGTFVGLLLGGARPAEAASTQLVILLTLLAVELAAAALLAEFVQRAAIAPGERVRRVPRSGP